VSATVAKVKFGEILADVSFGKNHVVVEKQGKPLAAIIPQESYEEYLHLKAKEEKITRKDLVDRVKQWRKELPPLPSNTPDGVTLLRELRNQSRFK